MGDGSLNMILIGVELRKAKECNSIVIGDHQQDAILKVFGKTLGFHQNAL